MAATSATAATTATAVTEILLLPPPVPAGQGAAAAVPLPPAVLALLLADAATDSSPNSQMSSGARLHRQSLASWLDNNSPPESPLGDFSGGLEPRDQQHLLHHLVKQLYRK